MLSQIPDILNVPSQHKMRLGSEGAWKIDKDLTGGGISGHVAMDFMYEKYRMIVIISSLVCLQAVMMFSRVVHDAFRTKH